MELNSTAFKRSFLHKIFNWPLSRVRHSTFNTFTVLAVPFAPPAAALGSLASGGEVGLCGGLAPGFKSLCDGGGIDRLGHAA